jgi:hypothetical protein
VTPADYLKCLIACSTVTIHGEVIVETCGLNDPQSLHNREACAIYNREILLREGRTNRPSDFEIAHRYNFYTYPATLYLVPKLFGDVSAITAIEQQPRFYQHVVGGYVIPRTAQNGLCPLIIVIPGNCGRKPD